MNKGAIIAEDLTYTYGQLTAVDHISFSVAEGEIMGFLGPNGAGKTTTIKLLTGQLIPRAGRATVLGLDVAKQAKKVQAQIGVCFEETNLYEQMSAEENLKLFARLFGVKDFDAGALRRAVEAGAVDVGVALPADFDDLIVQEQEAKLVVYVWGQSLARSRAIAGATIAHLIREVAGQESPVEIITTTLGNAENIPWEDRLLPFVVLITVLMGGAMVPATSLVEEKQKQTLTALTTTPTSLEEVLLAKGLLGVILSLVVGVLILVMNRALGVQPLLLLLVLGLGAAMAAAFGVLLGVYVKDINTLSRFSLG